ncbi:hypothetical protein Taro_044120 [Colocasia esculenta]|uniref:3-oxoacyl-[acyl-carrier-protein] synthase n=1 Tax=Colocasia esculenta TaxID=4460 RepID=A0A843WTR8_COLES|nr:hypothetical protein [Colocasia esculenta]
MRIKENHTLRDQMSMISTTPRTSYTPKRERDPKKRVVVTGMGLVSVFGNDVNVFYDKLLHAQSGVSRIDRFDPSSLPVHFGAQIDTFTDEGDHIDEELGSHLDACWRYCLVAGMKAIEDANLGVEVLKTMDRSRIGVLLGSSMGGVTTFNKGADDLNDQEGMKKLPPFFIPYSSINMGSILLASHLNLSGPAYSINAACATSNFCLYSAANHIRRGEAEVMVVGGTDSGIHPSVIGGFSACRALSQRNGEPRRASRPWDKGRDGFVLGEGSAVLIMENLEHARRRGANIIAEYLGGAITCDAYHMTNPRPDGMGICSCILRGLENAGVSPEEVNYINAHASSTPAGDLVEVNAIKKVFKDTSQIKMNGTKSMIGHCLGAAGALEAIVTIKAITTGWLHPTINQDDLEPEVTIDTIPDVKRQHEVHVAISNSFGFGGQNSVVVFAPFKP